MAGRKQHVLTNPRRAGKRIVMANTLLELLQQRPVGEEFVIMHGNGDSTTVRIVNRLNQPKGKESDQPQT